MQGTIVKAISGFYYVLCDEAVYECRARGVFRNRGITPLVGDCVVFEENTVIDILPRLNEFDRPPAANVEIMLLVMTAASPAPSFEILDKLTVNAESKGCKIIICVNKIDEAEPELVEKFRLAYKDVYPLVFCSAKTGEGIAELKSLISGRNAALCGPSGVGKSSLTNALLENAGSITGEISERTGRGKNTTRHTELFIGSDFLVFDTPGFTSFDVNGIPSEKIAEYFPEIKKHLGKCQFNDCAHLKEPGCAVTDAVRAGLVSRSRYRSYRSLYTEAKQSEDYYG